MITKARRTKRGPIALMIGEKASRQTVRRNKLLGMWAAEKLGIRGREAEAYSDALAVGGEGGVSGRKTLFVVFLSEPL